MFAYCSNNPVNFVDPTGYAAETPVDVISLVSSVLDFYVDPSLSNVGFVCWDTIAVFIPVAPGSWVYKGAVRAAGGIVKGSKVGKRVTKAKKSIGTTKNDMLAENDLYDPFNLLKSKASKAIAAASKKVKSYLSKPDAMFEDVVETKDMGNKIQYKMKNGTEVEIPKSDLTPELCDFSITGCFTGDTPVFTEKGTVRIDTLAQGDFVYAKDVKTGIVGLKQVEYVYIKNTTQFIYLNVEGEVIKTTPTHLFFCDSGWWKAAENINVGDKIVTVSGSLKSVISKEVKTLAETERIYNLNVEGYHTYFVGNQGMLVHNNCTADMMAEGREAIEKAKASGITDPKTLSEIGTEAAEAVKKDTTIASNLTEIGENLDDIVWNGTRIENGVTIVENIGAFGEHIAETLLKQNGWGNFKYIKNNSDNGLDIVAQCSDGRWGFFEIKTSSTGTIPDLSPRQVNMDEFVNDVLSKAKDGLWPYQNIDIPTQNDAKMLYDLYKEAPFDFSGNVIGVDLISGIIRVSRWDR